MIHLTKTECSSMRGVAILGIMLHNYCHWLKMAVKENEFIFSDARAEGIVNAIMNPSWNLPVHLLSFFGHYGVPVFLFLSAYGLTLKYERGGADDRVWHFLKKHFVKLFSMMMVGFALFVVFDRLVDGPHKYELMDVVSMIGMFGNVLPSPDKVIWPGPYWFFGLMMQLYIIYRLFLYKRHWAVTVLFMMVCLVLQWLFGADEEVLNRLRYNFIGGMLPFGLGLLYGRTKVYVRHSDNPAWVMRHRHIVKDILLFFTVLCLIFAVLMWSLDFMTWLFVPVLICALSVAIVKLTPSFLNNWLAWIGSISSAIFIFHPVTRKIFIPISRQGDIYTGLLLYVVATIALAYILQMVLNKQRS